jgi:hypothetical protein
MNARTRIDLILPLVLSVFGLAAGVWLTLRSIDTMSVRKEWDSRVGESPAANSVPSPEEAPAATSPDLSNALLEALREQIERPHALENQALLTFSDAGSLADFVEGATAAGLVVTGPFDGAHTLRVSFASLGQLHDLLAANRGKDPVVSANFPVGIPGLSAPPPAGGTGTAPFESSLLPSLGIDPAADRASWGEGVTVAVIDSGISPHPAFREGQITHLDLSGEAGALHPHGTAMASLVAGAYPAAEGIAPGAGLLDLRIAGKKGLSDSFLLANAIHTAIEQGAGVINISMATYGDAAPVAGAVAEAIRRGITVVAAVGNEGAGMKAWPAAYPGVISVSGVAADGSLAYFSNTGGPTLAAPSVGVPSAYHDGASPLLAIGNGTSQAAALVSGAAAAFRSRGLDVSSALTGHARPGSGKKEEIGAGILFLPPIDRSPPAKR